MSGPTARATLILPPKGKTNDYPDWQVNIAQLSWQHKWFTLMGQYYWGKGTSTSTEDKAATGWVGAGFVRIPGVEKMRLFGKVDYYDPNKDKSNNARNGLYRRNLLRCDQGVHALCRLGTDRL